MPRAVPSGVASPGAPPLGARRVYARTSVRLLLPWLRLGSRSVRVCAASGVRLVPVFRSASVGAATGAPSTVQRETRLPEFRVPSTNI